MADHGAPQLQNSDSSEQTLTEAAPLLGDGSALKKTRAASSVVHDGHDAHLAIPPGVEHEREIDEEPRRDLRTIFAILSVLLLGVFISQMDSTLMFATIGNISSEFDDLQSSAWLFSSFGLAMCAAQPLYGKLSNIFGRKAVLQVAYGLFGLGGSVTGLGRSMGEIIVGRVIQGAGSAGMVVLVSILITDLVPLREVAAYRSYVNIVSTIGRSAGGPIGGAFAQTIGWRSAFVLQAPLAVLAMLLVAWKLKVKPKSAPLEGASPSSSLGSRLRRIDFVGALFISSTVLGAMLILDLGGDEIPWRSPLIAGLAAATVCCGVCFYITEKHWAQEPIFPLRLLFHKHVVLDYLLSIVQIASQTALMYCIPLYFQITKSAGSAEAGAYMVPSVIGNTIGGLLTGHYVRRTSRYKLPIVIAGLSATLCFTLLILTWRGDTPAWEAMFPFFGGFATGTIQSAVFVDMAASVDESDIAVASSGLYLSGSMGAVVGVSSAGAVLSNSLQTELARRLLQLPEGRKLVRRVSSNIEAIQRLKGPLHDLVVAAYVAAFRNCFIFSLGCGCLSLLMGLVMREKRLSQ